MVSATRTINSRTPRSRCGVPNDPCKYLLATILMAVMDQSLGDSTSFCSKMVWPLASVMMAVRFSHSTSSYGETPLLVKCRENFSPEVFRADDVVGLVV